jgi:hypothetical protein
LGGDWTEPWDIVGTIRKPLELDMHCGVLPAQDHQVVICSVCSTREEVDGQIVVHIPEDQFDLVSAAAASAGGRYAAETQGAPLSFLLHRGLCGGKKK